MPAKGKKISNIQDAEIKLRRISGKIKQYKKYFDTLDETELQTLRKFIKKSKNKYYSLQKNLQKNKDKAARDARIGKKIQTNAKYKNLQRVLKEMDKVRDDLHHLHKKTNQRIEALQVLESPTPTPTVVDSPTPIIKTPMIDSATPRVMSQISTIIDPLTRSELQSVTPRLPSTVIQSLTPLINSRVINSLTPRAISQLSTIIDPLTRSELQSPTPIVDPLKISQLSTIVDEDNLEDGIEEIKNRVIKGVTTWLAKENKNLSLNRRTPIEVDARDFLRKKSPPRASTPPKQSTPAKSSTPARPSTPPKPSRAAKPLPTSISTKPPRPSTPPTLSIPPNLLPRPKSSTEPLTPITPPPLPLESTPYIRCVTTNPLPILQVGGTRDMLQILNAQEQLLHTAVTNGYITLGRNSPPIIKQEPMIRSKTIIKQEPVIKSEPIITPDKEDPTKVTITTMIPKPNSPKPAAIIVSKVKMTKENKEKLQKLKHEKGRKKAKKTQKEKTQNQYRQKPPLVPNPIKTENQQFSKEKTDTMDNDYDYSSDYSNGFILGGVPPHPSSSSGLGSGSAQSSYTRSGSGAGGSSNLLTDSNTSVRMQDQGHFMDGVGKFNHNLSKSELFHPEPTKRNAENIDPLAQQAQIIPYWETNGLENVGVLPPSMTTANGAFNKPVTTNPQKFVFMTYQSGINKFYNCKLPMKVNIPSGDFGIYKVTVNEVLFRTDMNLLDADDYIDFTFNDPLLFMQRGNARIQDTVVKEIKLPPVRISLSAWTAYIENLHINYLNIDTLVEILNNMIEFNDEILWQSDGGYKLYLRNILHVSKQKLAGVGLYFYMEDLDEPPGYYFKASKVSFNISNCSTNFRHILPPLQTTTAMTSTKNTFFNLSGEVDDIIKQCNSIYIPRCNFAGPQLILFNSSAQTTCPISNEYAKQFNTCALSYNTNEDTNSLIQMTSNVELTMKNTNEFRVWLTDNYGEPIKIQSPIYVQVTVQPFVNETSTAMNE